MKNYHAVTLDASRNDLLSIIDYKIGIFEIEKLWEPGKIDEKKLINELALVSNDTGHKVTDAVGNPLSLLIYSRRLINIVYEYIKNDAQVIKIPIFVNGDAINEEYFLVHPWKSYCCINMDKSDVSWSSDGKPTVVGNINIIAKNIPSDVNIFRSGEDNNLVLVSDELAKSIVGKNMNGISFVRCS